MAPTSLIRPATDREALAPYIERIGQAAAERALDPFRLAGLILRESGAGWVAPYRPKGDPCGWGDDPDGPAGPRRPWAFGLCQIDRRWHSAFIDSPAAKEPLEQFRYACGLLAANRRSLQRRLPKLAPELLESATFAAYNAALARVYRAVLAGQDPDSVTTGRDYSRDVFRRAEVLRGEHPALFAKPQENPT